MNRLMFLIISLFTLNVNAQVNITGTISNKEGEKLLGANIYFEGSYNGTTSGADGRFILETDLSGRQKLIIRLHNLNV